MSTDISMDEKWFVEMPVDGENTVEETVWVNVQKYMFHVGGWPNHSRKR